MPGEKSGSQPDEIDWEAALAAEGLPAEPPAEGTVGLDAADPYAARERREEAARQEEDAARLKDIGAVFDDPEAVE